MTLNDNEKKFTDADFFEVLRAFLDSMDQRTLVAVLNGDYENNPDCERMARWMGLALNQVNETLFKSGDGGQLASRIMRDNTTRIKDRTYPFTLESDIVATLSREFICNILKDPFDVPQETVIDMMKFTPNSSRADPNLSLHMERMRQQIGEKKLNSEIKLRTPDGTYPRFGILNYLYLETWNTARSLQPGRILTGTSHNRADVAFKRSKLEGAKETGTRLTGFEFFNLLERFLIVIDEAAASSMCMLETCTGVSRRGMLMFRALKYSLHRMFETPSDDCHNFVLSVRVRGGWIADDISRVLGEENEDLACCLLFEAFLNGLLFERRDAKEYSNEKILGADPIQDGEIARVENLFTEEEREGSRLKVESFDIVFEEPKEYSLMQVLCQEIYLTSLLIPDEALEKSNAGSTQQMAEPELPSICTEEGNSPNIVVLEEEPREESSGSFGSFVFPDATELAENPGTDQDQDQGGSISFQ